MKRRRAKFVWASLQRNEKIDMWIQIKNMLRIVFGKKIYALIQQRKNFYATSRKGAKLKRELGPNVRAIVVEAKNGLFAFNPEEQGGVGRELLINGNYGSEEIEKLSSFISSDAKVLIVGGHIGTLAIPISKVCHSVIVIEANPNTFFYLEMNIKLNEVKNCKAFNIAASSHEEEIDFLLNRVNAGGSKRVPKYKKYMYYYDNPESINIKAFKLDDYLRKYKFDIVIMDIEGSEYFALQGMQNILANSKILAIEFVPHHLKNAAHVNVHDFLSFIEPHFLKLEIPSKKCTISRDEFSSVLGKMYDQNEEDQSIIFYKKADSEK